MLGTVLTVQSYVVTAVVVVGISTLATAALVFMLSLRLRRRERETMHRIGGSQLYVTSIMASEVALTLIVGATLAAGLTLLTEQYGAAFIRGLIL